MPQKENFEFAEERRLFYVALTRAKQKVYLLARQDRPSSFIEEIVQNDRTGAVIDELADDRGNTTFTPKCRDCDGFLLEREGPHSIFYDVQIGNRIIWVAITKKM